MARTARRLLTVAIPGRGAVDAGGPCPGPGSAARRRDTGPGRAPRAVSPSIAAMMLMPSRTPLPAAAASAADGWEPEFLQVAAPAAGPARARCSSRLPRPVRRRPTWNTTSSWTRSSIRRGGGSLGWFTDVQIQVIHPHLNFGQMRLITRVKAPSGQQVIVAPGAAKHDWTVAPRIEIGYRLPSGFGGLAFSDRFFNTVGDRAVHRAGRLDDPDDPASA